MKIGKCSKMLKNDTVIPSFPFPPYTHTDAHTERRLNEVTAESMASRMVDNKRSQKTLKARRKPLNSCGTIARDSSQHCKHEQRKIRSVD